MPTLLNYLWRRIRFRDKKQMESQYQIYPWESQAAKQLNEINLTLICRFDFEIRLFAVSC